MATGSSGIVKFDLETLEPVLNTPNIDASDVVDEIPFLYSQVQVTQMILILICHKITTTNSSQTVKMKISLHILSRTSK